jgi:hypothetical protein
MIEIKGRCIIEVELEGLDELNKDNFTSLLVEEDAGGIPASFDLILRQVDYRLLEVVRKTNAPIKISYGKDAKTRKTHDFVILGYDYLPSKTGLDLTLTGILDLVDYVSKPAISFIDDTSDKVFSSFAHVTPKVEYTGADKQVWLRHNITEKAWFDRVLHKVFIAEDDVVLSAITVSKELIVVSAKTQLAKKEVKRFSNSETEPTSLRIHTFRILSNTAYLSKFLSEGRGVHTVSLLERKLEDLTPKPTSLDGKVYSHTQDNAQYPPVLDNGNCHEEYYNSPVNNLSKLVDFQRNIVELPLYDIFLSDDDLKLLDPVFFVPPEGTSGVSHGTPIGKYLVQAKKVYFSQKELVSTLTFARPNDV